MNRADARPYLVALTLVLTALAVSCGDDGPSKPPAPTTLSCQAAVDPAAGTAPLAVAFQASCSGGTSPYTFSWTFGDGGTSTSQNPPHTYQNPGAYEAVVTARDSGSPPQTAADTLTVAVTAVMSCAAQGNPTSGVAPLAVNFQGSAAGGTPPYTYGWVFGDGGTSAEQNPLHTYQGTGSFDAILTAHDSASPQETSADTVHVTVTSGLTCQAAGDPTSGFAPLTTAFQGSASGGTPPYSYAWTFGDGGASTAQNPSHEYQSAGSFEAVLTVEDAGTPTQSCQSPVTVTVLPGLLCEMTANPLSGLSPLNVTFTASASGGTPPYTYGWAFGDGGTSTSRNPFHIYHVPGTYRAVLTVQDSASPPLRCQKDVVLTAAFPLECESAAIPAQGPAPLTVSFVGSVSGGTLPYSYEWDFGDGRTSAEENPTTVYEIGGTYAVSFLARDGGDPPQSCSDTVSVFAIGELSCQASGNPTSGPVGLNVTFQATALGGLPPYFYFWVFGDGGISTQPNPTHVYQNAGSYTATLAVQDASTPAQNCQSTVPVTVAPLLVCGSSGTPTDGVAPLDVAFSSSASGGTPPYTHAWTFGDGAASASQNPMHVYTGAGAFEAVVTVLDSGNPPQSCSDTTSVIVRAALSCSATAEPLTGPAPLGVQFTGTASGGTPPYAYTWDFDDGSVGEFGSMLHTFARAGTYDVTLLVQDSGAPPLSCQGTGIRITVTVPALSIPDAGRGAPLGRDGDGGREAAPRPTDGVDPEGLDGKAPAPGSIEDTL